jgi:hypothetical protein
MELYLIGLIVVSALIIAQENNWKNQIKEHGYPVTIIAFIIVGIVWPICLGVIMAEIYNFCQKQCAPKQESKDESVNKPNVEESRFPTTRIW